MSISYQKKIANSIIQKSFAHNQFGYPSFTDYWHIICIKITPRCWWKSWMCSPGKMGSWLHHTPGSFKWPPFSKGTPSQNCLSSEDHWLFYWGHIRSPGYLSQSLPEGKRAGVWAWDRKSPFSFQGEPSNLGVIYFIESLGRQTGPTPPQWQSRHPYSYTVP